MKKQKMDVPYSRKSWKERCRWFRNQSPYDVDTIETNDEKISKGGERVRRSIQKKLFDL